MMSVNNVNICLNNLLTVFKYRAHKEKTGKTYFFGYFSDNFDIHVY